MLGEGGEVLAQHAGEGGEAAQATEVGEEALGAGAAAAVKAAAGSVGCGKETHHTGERSCDGSSNSRGGGYAALGNSAQAVRVPQGTGYSAGLGGTMFS